jgi:hypothetical protein
MGHTGDGYLGRHRRPLDEEVRRQRTCVIDPGIPGLREHAVVAEDARRLAG